MIEDVTGDLFDRAFKFDGIGHGVNCQGVMGSGIAPLFKERWYGMYKKYKAMCEQGFLLPGMVYPYYTGQEVSTPNCTLNMKGGYIYNIASQYRPGRDARISYLAMGMKYVVFHAEQHRLKRVGLPRIGAGIGGLDWNLVHDTIESIVADSPVMFTLVSLES